MSINFEDLVKQEQKNCISYNNKTYNSNDYCERYFDGLLCWNYTKAGTLATKNCPFGLMKEFVTLFCEENGQWYFSPIYNKTWTNFSACQYELLDDETAAMPLDIPIEVHKQLKNWLKIINKISWIGYELSLITLCLSMVIFMSLKRLRCPRNRLHMHLFMSFILRALMFILKECFFVKGVAFQTDIVSIDGKQSLKEHNFWLCKAFTSARWYVLIANCFMVLMEGIYLHNLMFFSVLSDKSCITVYYICGWVLPILIVIPWSILRALYEDDICWTTNKDDRFRLLLDIPQGIAIIINFVLFVIILRILFLKLGSMFIQQRGVLYRRLIRSTLILIPLYGVPYVISLILGCAVYIIPDDGTKTLEIIWLLLDQCFVAFQGSLIAFIYCLFNGEVHAEIARFYAIKRRQRFKRSRERTISSNTQCTIFLPTAEEMNQDNFDSNTIKTNCEQLNNHKQELLLLKENDLNNKNHNSEDCVCKNTKF